MKRALWTAGLSAFCAVLSGMLAPTIVSVCLLSGLIVAAVVLYARKKTDAGKTISVAAAAFAVFFLLFTAQQTYVVAPSLQLEGQTVTVTGRLEELPDERAKSIRLKLSDCAVNDIETGLNVIIYTDKAYMETFSLYSQIRVSGVKLEEFTEEGEFYYHTLSGGYWLSGYSKKAELVSEYDGHSPFYYVKLLRNHIKETLLESLGDENGAVAAALLIGDRSELDARFTNRLRIAGASHLFAVSGMHLSIWAGLIFLFLRNRTRVKRFANLLTCVFIVFYASLTGFSPSVCRAAVMLLCVLIGKIVRYQSDPLNALGFSALILLSFNVYLAGNVSFLLSFSATAAIVIVYPYFVKARKKKENPGKRAFRFTRNAVLLTFSVLLFTVPFSAFFFGVVSLLSPVSTIFLTLPIEAVMLLSCFGVLFSFVPFVSDAIFWLDGLVAGAIRTLVGFLSNWDFAVFGVRFNTIVIWYAVTALILIIVYFAKRKGRLVMLVSLVSTAVLLLTQITLNLMNAGKIEIRLPAAGNSTAIVVTTYTGSNTVLIGTGSDYDARRAINDTLKARGICAFDTLIVPRDSDAENGNTEYYVDYPVRRVYTAEGNRCVSESGLPYQAVDNFEVSLPYGLQYRNVLSDGFSAGVLWNSDFKAVICYYPGSDFSDCEEALTSGDVLICRGDIPKGLSLDRFGEVYVLSDKTAEALRLPDGVISTADVGEIVLITHKE
ncbi:MAG: ComEC/Rec2 family competence protein [Oscillospiraceae bacterium]|nr:ComEC/Rec2 family competence protein [Oscillospiraceae bacterium]